MDSLLCEIEDTCCHTLTTSVTCLHSWSEPLSSRQFLIAPDLFLASTVPSLRTTIVQEVEPMTTQSDGWFFSLRAPGWRKGYQRAWWVGNHSFWCCWCFFKVYRWWWSSYSTTASSLTWSRGQWFACCTLSYTSCAWPCRLSSSWALGYRAGSSGTSYSAVVGLNVVCVWDHLG